MNTLNIKTIEKKERREEEEVELLEGDGCVSGFYTQDPVQRFNKFNISTSRVVSAKPAESEVTRC